MLKVNLKILVFILFSTSTVQATSLAKECLPSDSSYKVVTSLKFINVKDVKKMHKLIGDSKRCLKYKNSKSYKAAVLKMYLRSKKVQSHFEHFEGIYSHYKKQKTFYNKVIDELLSKDERKKLLSEIRELESFYNSGGNG